MDIPGKSETAPANVPATRPGGQPAVHASERVGAWLKGWRRAGRLVLLLDFDGTLAPIVPRPEMAELPPDTRSAIQHLRERGDVDLGIISGRALADVRARVDIEGIAYAGNHGMEIAGPGMSRLHPEAAAARPRLEQVARELRAMLDAYPGAWLEDKGLTLSLHYRALAGEQAAPLIADVEERVSTRPDLHLTRGKKVLEVRPRVDWHKGRAALFLLEQLDPPAEAPVLYFGDDTTDEDAFAALQDWRREGEGVLVSDAASPASAARSYVRSPAEVGEQLAALASAPGLP